MNRLIPIYPVIAIVCEAVARLATSFASLEDRVAVVGSMGFVGAGVVKLLKEQGINVIELDKAKGDTDRDIKQGVLAADIVVSATGRPNLIKRDYLKPEHKIVLDTGFIPQEDEQILGDVAKDAYDIPQNLTPVPGGIGPTQMAVLLERIVRMADLEVQSWDYKKDFLDRDTENITATLQVSSDNLDKTFLQQQRTEIVAPLIFDTLTRAKITSMLGKENNVIWNKNNQLLTLSDAQIGMPKMLARFEGGKWIAQPLPNESPGLSKKDVRHFQQLFQANQQSSNSKKPDLER